MPRIGLLGILLLAARDVRAQSIVHQITLGANQGWCDDSMINALFSEINSFRTQNGVAALAMNSLGMKDAEMRATQFAEYMATHTPGSVGFNPHTGYDTTAASLGYYLISENLAYMTTSPINIVWSIWQDPLHLAAMLASDANVAGVSCIYSNGTTYWTYEPGYSSQQSTPPVPPPPSGTPTLDSEQWAFLTLINNYRAQNGVGPLQVSVILQQSSQWMSTDMATKNYASHTDSLGRDPGARLAAFGYSSFTWGENIAGGYGDAQNTLNQWATACDPDGSGNCTYAHKVNMLRSSFAAIGIGRAYSSSSAYGWYWTTDFGGTVDQAIPPPGSGSAPTISSFTATPSSITTGQSSTLAWSVSGATSVVIDNAIGAVSSAASKSVSPSQTTTYKLTATNASGTSTAFAAVTVTSPPVCSYAIAPTGQTFPATGGPGSVVMYAGAGCAWTATSNTGWLSITSGSSGNGNGTVGYSVAANATASQRQGTMTIGGKTFTVTQPGSVQRTASKVGIFRPSAFMMVAQDMNGNIAWDQGTDHAAFFGIPGDTILYGDWDGSGKTKLGMFRPGAAMFALDMNGNGSWDSGIDVYGFFGQPGDVPIIGDWNGNGKSKIGIYRPSTALFALDYNGNMVFESGVDKAHAYGLVGDKPIIGDWTGDGKAKVGIYRNGFWSLDNNNDLTLNTGDTFGTIGQAGDTPLLGDWNGDGRTKVGFYRSNAGLFGEDYNGNLVWDAGDRTGNFGSPGSTPVVGDWTGSGVTRVGVFYGNGYWALDYNGNLAWDAGVHWGGLGASSGDTPVVGRW